MDINEIAKAVQAGEADTLELWIAVRRFAMKFAIRWERALGEKSGMEREDFMQVAFIAMLDAVKSWDPQAGSFINWLSFILRRDFQEATGIRTVRSRNDPLRFARSLDTPMINDSGEEVLLSDIMPDPAAERPFEEVAELDFMEKRREAVETAIASLPAHLQEAVRAKYYRGEKADKVSINAALRHLRHPSQSRLLRPYMV